MDETCKKGDNIDCENHHTLSDEGDDALDKPLYWEPTYEIVLALMEKYPSYDLDQIGYGQLMELIVAIPNFADDPAIASEELLRDILREWYEESIE